jgi:glutamine amidotransferase
MDTPEKRICILNYGSGNVKSVYNLSLSLTPNVLVSNVESEIERATHIILPGVGSFGAAMRKIRETLPLTILEKHIIENKKPFLGICVGMQVLATTGEEFGKHNGLNWIPGSVELLKVEGLALPHIGWNNVNIKHPSPILKGLDDAPDFYFVHSYAFHPKNAEQSVAMTSYGQDFCSVIQKDNIFGVQFHPEKSQDAGRLLVSNFLKFT